MMDKLESSSGLFLPKPVLQVYGCKNCIWKNNGQCPQGFTKPEQSVKEGYCEEFGSFILNFGEPEDSISAVMEKFHLYTQQECAMVDNREYVKSFQKLKEFRANSKQHLQELGEEAYNQKLGKLEMNMNYNKIWWSRLTDSVVKGLGRIADRERRSKDVQGTEKITVQQLNVLLKESDKILNISSQHEQEVDK